MESIAVAQVGGLDPQTRRRRVRRVSVGRIAAAQNDSYMAIIAGSASESR